MSPRRDTPPEWKALMDDQGISSLRDLALKAELSHVSVVRLVHGESIDPSDTTLMKVADALKVAPIRIYRMAGYSPAYAEPWSPPAEATRLTPKQRKAVEELIKSMVDPMQHEYPTSTKSS